MKAFGIIFLIILFIGAGALGTFGMFLVRALILCVAIGAIAETISPSRRRNNVQNSSIFDYGDDDFERELDEQAIRDSERDTIFGIPFLEFLMFIDDDDEL